MSIARHLEKLAEKKALAGDYSFASALLEEADKRSVKTSAKGSFKSKIKELKGFTKMEGESFCFDDKDAAKKGLAIAEQSSNFVAWKIEKCKDGWKLVSDGYDKKSSTLKSLIRKYAQPMDNFDDFDIPESGKDLEGEWKDMNEMEMPEGEFGLPESDLLDAGSPRVEYDEDDLGSDVDDLGSDDLGEDGGWLESAKYQGMDFPTESDNEFWAEFMNDPKNFGE